MKNDFILNVEYLLKHPLVREMSSISHHTKYISCLDHCLFVAYVSYILSNFIGGDCKSIVRAALLHDLYLCDWKKEGVGIIERLFIHPDMAIENAKDFNLTEMEQNIIKTHMWPVTIKQVPSYKESIIVNIADKICAIAEVTGVYWLLKCCRNLKRHLKKQFV